MGIAEMFIVSLIGVLILTAVIGGIALLLLSGLLQGLRGDGKRKDSDDEAALIQELNAGLGRLERRIESLETLILDRADRGEPAERESHRVRPAEYDQL